MNFLILSQYFEKLEATTKRLELVSILAELFKKADSKEVGKICYLIQGRVAPSFEPIEIGMAENLVALSISKAFNKSKDEVMRLYLEKGNMGLAAQKLAEQFQTIKYDKELTVCEVFAELRKIAEFGGEGAIEKKVVTLANLLKMLDPISVKHVTNIPLGTLRLGVGDPTILDALSLAKKGDKSLRATLEAAYNRTSDLGYVAEIYYKHGEDAIKRIKLVIGKPVRPALAERLPSVDEVIKRVGSEFAAEPKFDGFRVQVHKDGREVKIFSRNLENTTHAFPDLVSGVLKEIIAKKVIFEGEAIAYNPQTEEFLPFQETTKRRRKYKVSEMVEKLPLVIFAFDLLFLDGRDMTSLDYSVRRKFLERIIIKNSSTIRLAEEKILHSGDEILQFFNQAVSQGLEGIMIKKLDAPYQAGGRGYHWIKFKRSQAGELTDTIDCVLLGVYSGKGKRAQFGVGGLLVGVYDEKRDEFVTISKIGTGLTDEEFKLIDELSKKIRLDHKPPRVNSKIEPTFWVEPKIVLEVYADEITRSPIHTAGWDNKIGTGFALRFPRVVKFRETDRTPEDATTVSEIQKMYKDQFKKM